MKIQRVDRDPARVEAFIRFGRGHYRGDRRWIPPFDAELRSQLSPESPFCTRPGNDAAHFLARSGDQVVGRISAMVNADLQSEECRIGSIGFFECAMDHAVATALFDAACSWLRRARSCTRARGPLNFDIWHDYRLMTRGFEQGPFYGEPYNKPYYPEMFTRYGWRRVQTWESVDLIGAPVIRQVLEGSRSRHEELLARGYRFETFDVRRFDAELEKLHGALEESFSGFLGFTPITLGDFRRHLTRLKYALKPGWLVFAYDPDGALAGFAGACLDLGDAVRSMRGRTGPLARLRFASRRRDAHRVVFYIVGISRTEAERGSGLGRAVARQVTAECYRQGYRHIIAALMAADGRSRSLVGGRGAMEAQREYALYEIDL